MPQVHLRQFCFPDGQGKLFVVKKSDGKEFWSHPKNICAIKNGNRNEHLTNPDLLEQLYAIFEPNYPRAIDAIRERKPPLFAREVISAFVASIAVSAPTFQRMLFPTTEDLLISQALELNAQEEFPPFPETDNLDYSGKSLPDLLKNGLLKFEIDMKMPQALASARLQNVIHAFSSAHWDILHNSSGIGFLTSDYPLALLEENSGRHLARFIPLAPDIGIIIYTPAAGVKLTAPSQCYYEVNSKSKIATLNRCVVKSAENFVISNSSPEWLTAIVKKYRQFHLVVDARTQKLEYKEGPMLPIRKFTQQAKGG